MNAPAITSGRSVKKFESESTHNKEKKREMAHQAVCSYEENKGEVNCKIARLFDVRFVNPYTLGVGVKLPADTVHCNLVRQLSCQFVGRGREEAACE